MNGAHDMGGMHGFGPVQPEPDEPVFHAEWERRAMALTVASGALGRWNIDMSRFAREQINPAVALNASYYERWLIGLARLLVQTDLLTEAELKSGTAAARSSVVAPSAAAMAEIIRRGGPSEVPGAAPARFRAGDKVMVLNRHPAGHTRAPRYVRGRAGVIVDHYGMHVFPDSNAAGRGKDPQHLYSVRFAATELWGPQANAHDSVHVDLWESYLEAAQ